VFVLLVRVDEDHDVWERGVVIYYVGEVHAGFVAFVAGVEGRIGVVDGVDCCWPTVVVEW